MKAPNRLSTGEIVGRRSSYVIQTSPQVKAGAEGLLCLHLRWPPNPTTNAKVVARTGIVARAISLLPALGPMLGLQLGQTISNPTIGSLRVKLGRTSDLMTDVDGGLSQAAVSETNGAEHDGGAAADGTDFQISQSKHEVLLHLSCSQGLCR